MLPERLINPDPGQTRSQNLAAIGALLALGVIRVLTGRGQLDKPREPRSSTGVSANEEPTDD